MAQGNTPAQQATLSAPVLKSNTFINCDLRFYNLSFLAEAAGSFDVVMIDPPW